MVVQILRTGKHRRWSDDVVIPEPVRNGVLEVPLPGGLMPREVFFASPDHFRFRHPLSVAFEASGAGLAVSISELSVHGTVILQY